MAIVQTEAQVVAMANAIGIYDERGVDIKTLEALISDEASLEAVCNTIGYYDETAAYLIAEGMTFN